MAPDAPTPSARKPVKVLTVVAVRPDDTVHVKQVTVSPDTPAAVLDFFERQTLELIRREFPDAATYRSLGWVNTAG